jgi:NitT/TauT family transport system ATP-binding protein
LKNKKSILKISGLSKSYKIRKEKDIKILDDINFETLLGEIFCILGPSGCGKTTLLNIIAGFLKPDAGKVLLDDEKINGIDTSRCMIFQEASLFPWLNVSENISFGLKFSKKTKGEIKKLTDEYINLTGLQGFENYLPEEISGGMKQRVSLARVLILHPKVILMDEPFAALDYQVRKEMQNLVIRLCRELNQSIIFVTHDISEAASVADKILILGKTPATIKTLISSDLIKPGNEDDIDYIKLRSTLFDYVKG